MHSAWYAMITTFGSVGIFLVSLHIAVAKEDTKEQPSAISRATTATATSNLALVRTSLLGIKQKFLDISKHPAWKYHTGDSAEWMKRAYDDAAWQATPPWIFTGDDASRVRSWQEADIGWFRLRLRIDSTLGGKPLALVLNTPYPCEIWLNETLIQRIGTPAATPDGERLPSFALRPIAMAALQLQPDTTYLLAVRYSTQSKHQVFERYPYLYSDRFGGKGLPLVRLQCTLWNAETADNNFALHRTEMVTYGAFIGITFIVALLHIVLFGYFRAEKANAVLALFSGTRMLAALSLLLCTCAVGQPFDVMSSALMANRLLTVISVVILLYALYVLFYPRLPRWHWLALAGGVAVVVLVFAAGSEYRMWLITLRLMLQAEGMRVVIVAIWRKQDGAWLIGSAATLFYTVSTLFLLSVIVTASDITINLPIGEFLLYYTIIYVSVPLAVSIVLARRAGKQSTILAQQKESLEIQVERRTAELQEASMEIQHQLEQLQTQTHEIEAANTQLALQNNALHILNNEKNELLGIAAHDLKNPLASIQLVASTLQMQYRRASEEHVLQRLEHIIRLSERMSAIISTVLHWNALESGQLQLHLENVDARTMLQPIIDEYRERAAVKNITLFYDAPQEALFVRADKQAFTETVENLLSNALKYSPHGKNIWIRINSKGGIMKQEKTSVLRLEIQDEGPGVSAEDMPKLFGKFTRLTARPTGGEHSTGLGLSIVKRMVEAMNGTVWCESEEGDGLPNGLPSRGARFIVELPRALS